LNDKQTKKTKILFWLDIALQFFGIAKFLQEKHPCEMFAIVDVHDKSKIFFQNQKFVNFQKLWFFRDQVSKINDTVDLKYLISFEKKYSINIWSIAYSERLFYQFNNYYKFNRHQILSIFEQVSKFFENVLDEIKPDYLVMHHTTDHQTQLLHTLCKARGIQILSLGGTRFGYRSMISEDWDVLDAPYDEEEHYPNNTMKSFEELIERTKKYPEQVKKRSKEPYQKFSVSRRLKAALKFFISIYNSNYRNYYCYLGRSPFNIIKNEGFLTLKKFNRESFLNKNCLRSLGHDPFIYFPLHFEPERTVSVAAPFYTNQIEVITHIAKSLPLEYKLYVKEHPQQVRSGWKRVSYYKKILELPNVFLIHPSTSYEELLKKCSLLVTINGTAGIEAVFYQKPVIVFADAIYSKLSSVFRVTNVQELPSIIRIALQTKVDLKEVNGLLNVIEKQSFGFDDMTLEADVYKRFFYEGFLNVEISTSEMKKFLEDNSSIFDSLASEFIKKINNLKKINEGKLT